MATSSFYENMVIDTPEAAANLELAFWEYKARESLGPNGLNILKAGENAREFFDNNPGWLENFIANAKEEMRKERLAQTDEERELDKRCFYDIPMVIDTPEAARNLEAAFREAMERGPMKFEGPSINELLERGREFLRNNPNWLNEVGSAALARQEARRALEPKEESDLTE